MCVCVYVCVSTCELKTAHTHIGCAHVTSQVRTWTCARLFTILHYFEAGKRKSESVKHVWSTVRVFLCHTGALIKTRTTRRLVQDRLNRLTQRIKRWTTLRSKSASDRRVAVVLYGYPPGIGATGTAALLNVPKSLYALLVRLRSEGYDVGELPENPVRTKSAPCVLCAVCGVLSLVL